MTYYLGIDLGTTYTAAAAWRDGRARIAHLGAHSATIPSVVLLRDDGEVLVGEAAERRALTEPQRIAREFKRRVGDPTPLIVGGAPYSADALTAKLLRSVVDQVSDQEGGPPAGIAVSHPANWGDYKKDLLRQSIRLADLDEVATLTEPEAAAIHYAQQEGIAAGSVVAVYDLGGGTFDAAVLRREAEGWQILGEPEGIEHLGGVDFDEAVFQHVARSALPARDHALDDLDTDDPPTVTAVARLRRECVAAKEALTSDTLASIPVFLPASQTEVRLTRGEFEDMIRPSLRDSVAALQRALRSAGVTADEVATVLLAGGSSRIPLVAQLVSEQLGRPVALDSHPKHGVALGAASVAADRGPVGVATQPSSAAVPTVPTGAADVLTAGSAAGASATEPPVDGVSASSPGTTTEPTQAVDPAVATDAAAAAGTARSGAGVESADPTPPESEGAGAPTPPQPQPAIGAALQPQPRPTRPPHGRPQARARADAGPAAEDHASHPVGLLVGAAVAAFLLLVVGLVALRTDGAEGRRDDDTAEPSGQQAPGAAQPGDDDGTRDDNERETARSGSSTTSTAPGTPTTAGEDGATSTTGRTGTTVDDGTTTTVEDTTTTTEATTTTVEDTTTTTAEVTTTTAAP